MSLDAFVWWFRAFLPIALFAVLPAALLLWLIGERLSLRELGASAVWLTTGLAFGAVGVMWLSRQDLAVLELADEPWRPLAVGAAFGALLCQAHALVWRLMWLPVLWDGPAWLGGAWRRSALAAARLRLEISGRLTRKRPPGQSLWRE